MSTRPLLEKLGVKPGARVALVNLADSGFKKLLRTRTTDVTTGRPTGQCDLVFIGASTRDELKRIAEVKAWIEPNGAIWVVRPKGGRSELRDTDVIDAGLAAGLVDNKIASFSDTHGAMRLVYRIKDRPKP
jgi:dipeptidyl aminopeptidase/acylaminoacyl peptidase